MSEQDIQAVVLLPPFDPSRACPKCLNEQVDTTYHQGTMPGSPCWTDDPARRVYQEHLDRRCLGCGYTWCELPADAYPDEELAGGTMTIRKTAASGEVLGTEGEEDLTKTASAAWSADAELELAAENDEADQG
jgi:hypothetical protein